MRLMCGGKVFISHCVLADTHRKRAKGLMFRKALVQDTGLLMVFPRPGRQGVWMPCMHFPIDVVFIGEDWTVLDVKHSVRPMGADPRTWRVYHGKGRAKYILETNAGAAKRAGVSAGSRLEPVRDYAARR